MNTFGGHRLEGGASGPIEPPKHICFVVDSFISDRRAMITGPMVQTYLLGKELLRRGWRVDYVAYSHEGNGGTEEHEGLRVHWIPRRRLFALLDYRRVMKRLKRIDAFFHYQRGRDVLTGTTARFCRAHDKKFVWASAGESGIDPGKYLGQLSRRRGLLKKLVLSLEARINDRVYEYGIRRADQVVVQTSRQQQRLFRNFGLPSVVIKSGHPLPSAQPRQLPLKVLWVGSIKRLKRPDLYVELAKMSEAINCEFWMAGQIMQRDLGEEVRRASSRLARFRFLGPVPFEKSHELIASVHAVVNTTEVGYEGLPNAFVQAWLAGTPTLSLHCDPDGVISTHRLGVVHRDLHILRNELERYTVDPSYWSAVSQNAAQFGKANHSLERVVDQLEGLLKSIYDGRRSQ